MSINKAFFCKELDRDDLLYTCSRLVRLCQYETSKVISGSTASYDSVWRSEYACPSQSGCDAIDYAFRLRQFLPSLIDWDDYRFHEVYQEIQDCIDKLDSCIDKKWGMK